MEPDPSDDLAARVARLESLVAGHTGELAQHGETINIVRKLIAAALDNKRVRPFLAAALRK